MANQSEVERIEPWQLPAYLEQVRSAGTEQVRWNKETLNIDAALARIPRLSPTTTVVVDGQQIYVAEPDHSADEPPPGHVPLQIWPRSRG